MFLLSIASLSSLGVSRRRFFRTPWYQELVCALVEGFYFVCPKNLLKKLQDGKVSPVPISRKRTWPVTSVCFIVLMFATVITIVLVMILVMMAGHTCTYLLVIVLIMNLIGAIIAIPFIIMLLDIAMMVCHSCVCWPVVGPENKFWPQTDKQNYQLYIPLVLQQKYLILYRKDINKYLLYLQKKK